MLRRPAPKDPRAAYEQDPRPAYEQAAGAVLKAAARGIGRRTALQMPAGEGTEGPAQLVPVRKVPRLARDIAREGAAPPANNGVGKIGTNAAQARQMSRDILDARAEGAFDIRVNQEQVNALGDRVGRNRPDLGYTVVKNGEPVRVNVEYDTASSTREMPHAERILANDPKAHVRLRTVP